MYPQDSHPKVTGPLGTENTSTPKSFYTAIRDFDYALRAVLAASPRQILAQGKDVMRKLDAIITACAAQPAGEKEAYFRAMKIRAQNAKTRAIGPLLRAVENTSQFGLSRPRLMSVLGTFDIQAVGREAAERDVQWLDSAAAYHSVAAYRLDQMLNTGLVDQTMFSSMPAADGSDSIGIVQKPAPVLNDSFDVLLSLDATPISQTARQLRRENQRRLLDVMLMTPAAVAALPPFADAALGFTLLALDGEMLTLAMDDLLDMEALGILSQQLIEMHAHLLHLELDGNMYNPAQWRSAAQMLF